MEFSYVQTNLFDKIEKTYNVSTNNLGLQDILEDFGMFLRGCGFVFDGVVDIVNFAENDPDMMAYVSEQERSDFDFGTQQKSEHFFDTQRNK
jgi:hypothetical protein